MDWTNEEHHDDSTTQIPQAVIQRKARLSFLNALAAFALVLGGS